MNTRFSASLIIGFAGLMLSGQALASPRFVDSGFFVRDDNAVREFGRQEDREARKDRRQADRQDERKTKEEDRERGFGYGYERRNPQPGHNDRGRR
jgi:hypothetical protein